MSDRPETSYFLPRDFAAALGQAVASFGWLEEVMKRAIYALDRAGLARDLTEKEMARWLNHMTEIADDSMGTLVEQLDAALRRHPGIKGRDALTDRLNAVKQLRNMLCHASWRPGESPAHWHPAFVNTKGETVPGDYAAEDLVAIREETLELGRIVIAIMRGTGIDGVWIGDDAG